MRAHIICDFKGLELLCGVCFWKRMVVPEMSVLVLSKLAKPISTHTPPCFVERAEKCGFFSKRFHEICRTLLEEKRAKGLGQRRFSLFHSLSLRKRRCR